jgi:hypothetical protein
VGGGGRGGSKSYNCKQAWSSVNHSILSDDSVKREGASRKRNKEQRKNGGWTMRGRTEERKRVESKYKEISEIDKARKEKGERQT